MDCTSRLNFQMNAHLKGNRTARETLTSQLLPKPSLTLSSWLANPEIIHGPDPEPALRVNGAVVTPEPLVILVGVMKSPQQLPRLGLPIEKKNPTLAPDQDLLARIDAFNISRHTNRHVKLNGRQGVLSPRHIGRVQSVSFDVDEAQGVCGG